MKQCFHKLTLFSIAFYFLLSLPLVQTEIERLIPIKAIKTKFSADPKHFSPYNIVNGTDYWKSTEVCCNNPIDMFFELKFER